MRRVSLEMGARHRRQNPFDEVTRYIQLLQVDARVARGSLQVDHSFEGFGRGNECAPFEAEYKRARAAQATHRISILSLPRRKNDRTALYSQLQYFPHSTPADFYNAWLPAASGGETPQETAA